MSQTAPDEVLEHLQGQEQEKQEELDVKKFVRPDSMEIELSIGNYRIQDLSATSIMVLMGACADIFVIIAENWTDEGEELDPLTIITLAANLPNFKSKLATFFALCCGVEDDPEELRKFRELPRKDFKALMNGIKEVVDFEEIMETFFEGDLLSLLTPTSSEVQE